jgi:Flagellar biosynthesis protein, FliO
LELRQLFSVILVFALLGGALWLLRRGGIASLSAIARARGKSFGLGRSQTKCKALVSIERLSLTPQHMLHLVKIHGREVVVATHPRGCELLVEKTEGPEA